MASAILSGKFFAQGNFAITEGAIIAGCRFFGGYPITPASEITERMSFRLPQVGGFFIQFEDEIASIMAVIGASYAGLKAMTATSGPGFSLMQESIGLAYMTEAPIVIVNVMRGGPSTGLPTAPSQADVMQVRWGTHGDHEIIALAPNSVQEMFDLTIEAFNYAEKYRIPTVLLADEILGHLREKLIIPSYHEIEKRIVNRKKPKVPPEEYLPFKPDPDDLVPPMANFGDGYRYYVTGLSHDERGYIVSDLESHGKLVKRLADKIKKNRKKIVRFEQSFIDDARIIVVSYGSESRSVYTAVQKARSKGIKVGLFRPITIWPFPDSELQKVSQDAKVVIVPEMNNVQLGLEVQRVVDTKVHFLPNPTGFIHAPEVIYKIITKVNDSV
ncbi:MAG: 2-oxoacid:acceptor oxidoreductase subunit alpha [Candidatus Asgardarchaeia archaeon]